MSLPSPIELLQSLRQRRYFAPDSWERRGLLPSDPQVIGQLEAAKCALIDELIAAHEREVDRDGLYAIALKHFAWCLDDSRLDTEECEFWLTASQMLREQRRSRDSWKIPRSG